MANIYLKVFHVLSQQENENQNGPENPSLLEWHSLREQMQQMLVITLHTYLYTACANIN